MKRLSYWGWERKSAQETACDWGEEVGWGKALGWGDPVFVSYPLCCLFSICSPSIPPDLCCLSPEADIYGVLLFFFLQFLGGLISCDAGDKRVRLAIKNLFPSPFLPGALGSAVIFYQTPQLLKSDTPPAPALVFWQLHLALPGRPELGDAAPWG